MSDPTTKIQRFLPEHYLNIIGKNLPSIYQAMDENIAETEALIQSCIDQLFLVTADGRYLIQLGEEQGFTMPANSGLDIRSYRVLVPIMVAAPKQVRISIEDLVEAFYGADKVRANVLPSEVGPYSLIDGDDLIVRTETGDVSVSIVEGQVSDLSNVSASEIAAVLNISQGEYIAIAEIDRSTGNESLKLVNQTRGSGAFLQIVGGTMQNILKFPNVVDTKAETGTVWNLTKSSIYSDELRFTWDGTGINPNIYRVGTNDFVTIRGLVDGAKPFSKINGSYQLVDSGYDYFVIRNDLFDETSAVLTQNADNAIVFTKDQKITLFDKDEYALVSETDSQTITVTVPAIPPLARRFLAGSMHVHGFKHEVVDFNRNNIQMNITDNEDKAGAPNYFLLTNDYQRAEFRKKQYYVTGTDTVTKGITNYIVDPTSEDYSALPFTVPEQLLENPIFGDIESSVFRMDFDFKHGLEHAWGFTLAGLTAGGNITVGDLNQEQYVKNVIDEYTLTFEILDANGDPIVFEGISFLPANVFRHLNSQADGSDFYIDFGTVAGAIASGLTDGIKFKFHPTNGTDVHLYFASLLRFRILEVTSVDGSKVNFSAGIGTGPGGHIINNIDGWRSGCFGGTGGTYFLDKSSTVNQERVMKDLFAVMTSYTQSTNEEYVGTYIYDPNGEQTNMTVSKYLVDLEENILKGQSLTAMFTSEPSEDFPQKGDLVLDYGKDDQEGPIPYRAVVVNPGSTQILIDPSYKFSKSHSSGAKVQYIHKNSQYSPKIDGSDFPCYLTGAVSARNTMFELIRLLVASGVFVESDVILPDLRYTDSSISPFE